MRKWISLLGIGLLALSLALAGCSKPTSNTPDATQPKETKPIKIGFFADQTGGASSLGTAEINTAKLVEEMLNAKGGIKGRKVEIMVIDSKSQDSEAVLAVKKLIEDGAVAIVGGTTTSATLAAVPTAEKEQVPFVSLAAGVGIIRPTKQWVFKTPQGWRPSTT